MTDSKTNNVYRYRVYASQGVQWLYLDDIMCHGWSDINTASKTVSGL